MIMPHDVNNHHALWQRAWYKSPIEKCLRTHRGLIVPIQIEVHKELHADIPPPPKPSGRLILGALAMLDELPTRILADPPQAIGYLHDHWSRMHDQRANRIAENIGQQLVYIEEGFYHG